MKKLLCLMACLLLVVAGCTAKPSTDDESKLPAMTAGTYTATTTAMKGDLTVEVTVTDKMIETVKVTAQNETFGIGYGLNETPVEVIPGKIVELQGLGVDFITGATITSAAIVNATADALAQAGADVDALRAIKPEAVKAEDEMVNTDIVIVGGGAAGLAAGISALDAGAENVTIIEKQGITGGATARSGGKLLAAGTSWQEKQGFTGDTPQAMLDYMYTMDGAEQLDDAKMESFAFNSKENLTWMEDLGVMVYDVEPIHSSIAMWRVHNTTNAEGRHGGGQTDGWGGNITVPMQKAFEEKGGKLIFNASANEIILNEGVVNGVKATMKDGSTLTVNANQVIIATGGYVQDREYMARYGEIVNSYATSVPVGNIGEGRDMAVAVGAKSWDAEVPHVVYVDYLGGVGINEEGGLIVNNEGNRVCNEYTYQYHIGNSLYKSGSANGWYITVGAESAMSVQYALMNPNVISAGSLEELAGLMGVPAENFVATVNQYNEYCANGKDEQFGKPAEYLFPIEGEKIYALKMHPAVTVSFGGLEINEESQVLDTNNEPIANLYAAGEVAFTGLFGNEYPSCGMAISGGVWFGRIAGQNAAEAILGSAK